MIADNDDNVVGEYRNGKLNGRGYTVVGKDWSQGWYTNGELTDSYSYIRNDRDMGCTTGDCQNKYGYFKWDNGDHFVGFFKNGKIYMGSYTFANGDKYSGMFNDQQQYHGTGRFFFKDGVYYGGEWKNGKYHGKGVMYYNKSRYDAGNWANGKFQGKRSTSTNATSSNSVSNSTFNTFTSAEKAKINACNGDAKCVASYFDSLYVENKKKLSEKEASKKMNDYLI